MRVPVHTLSLFTGGLFLISAALGAADAPAAKETPAPAAAPAPEALATVAGRALYEKDLRPLVAGQLRQFQQQKYEIERKALDQLIEQKLLEAEAKKQGVTPEKLLAQEVEAKVQEPSDAEVEGYYLALKAQLNKPLAEVKPLIVQRLKQASLQQAREDYLSQLRRQAKVAVYLSPPRVEVAYDPYRLKGSTKAPVTIVEFADYQCPFCGRVEPTLKELLSKYDGKVRLAYRDFPLSQIHPYAQKAAEASRCAEEQGKFWEYHDLLFGNQAKLDKQSLIQDARTLKLDDKKFEECLESGKTAAAVAKDLEDGKQAGVSGTPAFFINGIALSGAVPAASFTALIDDELARGEGRASIRIERVH